MVHFQIDTSQNKRKHLLENNWSRLQVVQSEKTNIQKKQNINHNFLV